ncbi:MAG: hypothetical protein IJ209_10075, partial [Bacteroidaceae bacterium]|nr:hypothetical protein [Bacteroidaceae bacterium]
FVHLQSLLKGCKITNSNRRALKTARKRLYFRDFKERLVHFNGTVVNKTISCEKDAILIKQKINKQIFLVIVATIYAYSHPIQPLVVKVNESCGNITI